MTDVSQAPPPAPEPPSEPVVPASFEPSDAQASGVSILDRLRGANPVLDRELRQRSRSARSMVIMTTFLFLALGLLYLIYLAETIDNGNPNSLANSVLNRQIGRTMFEWILMLEMLVILFVVPGLSAGAISGERDRQTLVPLQVTLVSPRGIFFGKVGAATAFVSLVVMASVPLLAIAYLVGGVSIKSVLMSVVTMMITGFLMATIGVAVSAIFRRTAAAVLASYGLVLLMTIGSGIALIVLGIISSVTNSQADDSWLFWTPIYLNPYIALAGAGGTTDYNFNDAWPLSSIKSGLVEVETNNNFSGPAGAAEADVRYVPLWIRSLGVQALLAALLAFAGLKKLKTPSAMVRQ